jgi:hypothetical protein
MTTRHLHCFYRQQLPVPGSLAQAVTYPACEWRTNDETGGVSMHPHNRFVCSWLTSDMAEVSRCEEVLLAISQIEAGTRQVWFADGDAFTVDFRANGVQFNPSHVGPDDRAYWNPSEGRFTLEDVSALLLAWRNFLATADQP